MNRLELLAFLYSLEALCEADKLEKVKEITQKLIKEAEKEDHTDKKP